MVGARRLETLRKLGVKSPESRSVRAACAEAARVLSGNPHDIPFAAIYVADEAGDGASLVASAGLPEDHPLPPSASLAAGDATPWPLAAVLRTGRAEEVRDLRRLAGPLPGSPWPEPPTARWSCRSPPRIMAAWPACSSSASARAACWDARYRAFFDLVAGHIGTALADARALRGGAAAGRGAGRDRPREDGVLLERQPRVPHPADPHARAGRGRPRRRRTSRCLPGQRERLETAHRNGLRLLKLVNTLLDFSRIEAGRARASYEPTDLAALTAELASNFRSACEKAGLRLVVDCPPLPEPVFVDRDMWEKVVLNLVSNAFKFTLEGEIAVRLRPVGGAVELSVRDTGTGIPAGELPRIFERFHRVEGARGPHARGDRDRPGPGAGAGPAARRLDAGGERRSDGAARSSCRSRLGTAHLPADRSGRPARRRPTAAGAAAFVEEALRWLPDEARRGRAGGPLGAGVVGPGPRPPRDGDARRPRVLLADDNADMRDTSRRLLARALRRRGRAGRRGGAAAARAARRRTWCCPT